MKKALIFLLLTAELLAMFGCGARRSNPSGDVSVQFFYTVRDADSLNLESVIETETRTLGLDTLQ